jgi:cytoplasmic iron level regulating protein YaaA (DUF328/UPF0246 family)
MHIVLSPSKTMDFVFIPTNKSITEPLYTIEANELMAIMEKMPFEKIKKLLGTSEKLTTSAIEMIKNFELATSKSALLAYDGDVYTGLDVKSWSSAELKRAENRISILSGLYGIVRAFDCIKPYRLDIAASLENKAGKTLYPYWKDKIAQGLITLSEGQDTIINLASDEYTKAVDWKQIQKQIVNVSFLNEKNGVRKIVSYDAKIVRGVMAKLIITKDIKKVDSLRQMEVNGYQYDDEVSTKEKLVFVKHQ